MNRIEEEKEVRLQEKLGSYHTVTELNEDFSLPDYQPEMKRLLRVSAKPQNGEPYIGTGNLDCQGSLDYQILYAGNDGALYCSDQTGAYRITVPVDLPKDAEDLICDLKTLPEAPQARMLGPRRLSVRCKLVTDADLYGTVTYPTTVDSGEAPQLLHGEAETGELFFGRGEVLELEDERLNEERDGDLRIISADGTVLVSEALAGAGTVTVRGEVTVKLLACHESETPALPFCILRKLPFFTAVETEGVEVNCDCTAFGVCETVKVTPDDGRILTEVGVRLCTKAQRNRRIAYLRDAYSLEASDECDYRTLKLPKAMKAFPANLSVNRTLELDEIGLHSDMKAGDITASAELKMPEYDRGKYLFAGVCRFHCVLWHQGEYCAKEFEVPFRYECDGDRELPEDLDARVQVSSASARIDGERIAVDAELAISLLMRGETEIRMLSESRQAGELPQPAAGFTLCYPGEDDTLWSVGKRYHRSMEALEAENNLPSAPAADGSDSLSGVRFLIV